MAAPTTPVIEMLWEAHDPRRALEERFGFGDAASAGHWVATTLHERWGVDVQSCDRIVISDRNALAWVAGSSGRLLAKWCVAPDRFEGLAQIARLTTWLDAQGLPVSAPIPAVDGRFQVETDGVSMNLQREIAADLLDVSDPAQVRAAGAVSARLHNALAGYPDAGRLAALERPAASLSARVTSWLDIRAERLPAAARDRLRAMVDDAPSDELPTQLLHFDFRSANILCTGCDVAAVLDFEELRVDHRIVELARSAIVLGTRYRDWGPIPSGARDELLAGYRSVNALTAVESGWWEIVLLWQAFAIVPAGDDPTGWGPSALALARQPDRADWQRMRCSMDAAGRVRKP